MNQYTLYRLYNYIGSLIDKYFNSHSNATGRWDIEHMFRPPMVLTRLNNEKSSFPFTEELLSLLNYVLFQQLGSLLYSSLAHISTIRNVGKVCIFSQNNREFGVIKLRQIYVFYWLFNFSFNGTILLRRSMRWSNKLVFISKRVQIGRIF